jgi:chromosome partitioning protein
VWLAHVFAKAGHTVLLVDADPSGSALEWSDLALMGSASPPQRVFPFQIVALPSRVLHRRVPQTADPDAVVIIDTPQLEDHVGIAHSALRYADDILIPCAPTPIETNRTTPVREEIAEVEAVRDRPARSAVLLNRCVARAHSTVHAREAFQDLGYDVLRPPCRGWRFTPKVSACRSPAPAAMPGGAWPANSSSGTPGSGRWLHHHGARPRGERCPVAAAPAYPGRWLRDRDRAARQHPLPRAAGPYLRERPRAAGPARQRVLAPGQADFRTAES